MRYRSILLLLFCSNLAAMPAHATERVAQKTQLNPSIHHDSTGLPTQVSGISASCGGANGTVVSSVPSGAAACAQGLRTVTDSSGTDGSYNWTCSSGSGQTVSCSAQTDSTSNITASCGAANGTSTTTLPTGSAACSTGTQSSTDPTGADGAFNWTCTSGSQTVACMATNSGSTGGGSTGGTTGPDCTDAGATCSATTASSPTCGCANGKQTAAAPSGTRACANGTLTVTDSTGSDGQFNWTCKGGFLNATTVSCSAPKLPAECKNGACGSANGTTVSSYPASSAACLRGTQWNVDPGGADGQYDWQCQGNGGTTATCAANLPALPTCSSATVGYAAIGNWRSEPTSTNNPPYYVCNSQTTAPSGNVGATHSITMPSGPDLGSAYDPGQPVAQPGGTASYQCVQTASGYGPFTFSTHWVMTDMNCGGRRDFNGCGTANGTVTDTPPTGLAACDTGATLLSMYEKVDGSGYDMYSWNCRSPASPNGSTDYSCSAARPNKSTNYGLNQQIH